MDIYESVLPSGRGVRFVRLRTKEFLSCNERVSAKLGDTKDPGGTRQSNLFAKEIIATCLKAVTAKALEWKEGADGEVDIDAMLDKAKWQTVTYTDLATDGPLSFDVLFEELHDFTSMTSLINGAVRPTRARAETLAGKVRMI